MSHPKQATSRHRGPLGLLYRMQQHWLFRAPEKGLLRVAHGILSIIVAAAFTAGFAFMIPAAENSMILQPHGSQMSEHSAVTLAIVFLCSFALTIVAIIVLHWTTGRLMKKP